MIKRIIAILFLIGTVKAFAPTSLSTLAKDKNFSDNKNHSSNHIINNRLSSSIFTPSTSTTALSEGRQWNFNNGRSPWGLKNNAEIWNGRVAQMAFVTILLQEAITGKGVIQALQDGDALGFVFLGFAVVSTVGLSVWLAIKGDESDIIF